MTDSDTTMPHTDSSTELRHWADIFYGMLVAPITTIEYLTHDEALACDFKNVVGAFIVVVLANGISGVVDAGLSGNQPTPAIVWSVEFSAVVMWLALSAILHIVCNWVSKREVDFSTSLISVGWAFMPLVFAGPMSCFRSWGIVYNLLAAIPVAWMCILQWLVFNHSLGIGSVRMFAILVLVPPLFIVTYFFWLFAAFASVARVLLG